MESVLEKLRKVKALADHGFEGEARAAKALLDKLLEKYGLSLDQLNECDRQVRKFTYGYAWERKLINQIIYSLFGDNRPEQWGFKGEANVYVDLTDCEFVEVSELYRFHRKQFKKEIERQTKAIYRAYLHKHGIFPSGPSDGECKLTQEEINDIRRAFALLDDVTYRKRLKN